MLASKSYPSQRLMDVDGGELVIHSEPHVLEGTPLGGHLSQPGGGGSPVPRIYAVTEWLAEKVESSRPHWDPPEENVITDESYLQAWHRAWFRHRGLVLSSPSSPDFSNEVALNLPYGL